jgi:hypothetical protein
MNRRTTAARVLLGLVFLVFGFDGLFHFFPLPPMPTGAAVFLATLVRIRLFYAVKAIEIASAVLLLSNRLVPLALAMLAPVIFNIVWFDVALDPSGLPVGLVVLTLELSSMWAVRGRFAPMFGDRSPRLEHAAAP